MVFDETPLNEASEHEPEEPDPGAEAEDVSFDVTSGEDLVNRLPDETDAPSEVVETFWAVVILVNVALFAGSIGPVLAYLWGWTLRGGILLLIAGVALGSAYLRYRRFAAAE